MGNGWQVAIRIRLLSTSTQHCTTRAISTKSAARWAKIAQREFIGIPAGGPVRPFTWDRVDDATRPLVYADAWKILKPTVIVHDVGRTKDRSTAVVGGKSMLAPGLKLLKRFEELPQGLLGSARAEALALVDRLYGGKMLMFVDVTFDPTYAETVVEQFGPERVIGVEFTGFGDGMTVDVWQTKSGSNSGLHCWSQLPIRSAASRVARQHRAFP